MPERVVTSGRNTGGGKAEGVGGLVVRKVVTVRWSIRKVVKLGDRGLAPPVMMREVVVPPRAA
jgi:hypothetical protein